MGRIEPARTGDIKNRASSPEEPSSPKRRTVMNSLAIDTQKSKHLISILALLFAVLGFALATGQAQQLQKGVSVQMAATRSAAPMLAADNPDAWVVTIIADGNLYFGADPRSEEHTSELQSRPH